MLTDFQNSFSDRFISKFAIKSSLIISPHFNCVTSYYTTLWNISVPKIAILKTWVYEASCHAKLSHSKQLLKISSF